MNLKKIYEDYKQAVWTLAMVVIVLFAINWTSAGTFVKNTAVPEAVYDASGGREMKTLSAPLEAERKISYSASANIEVAKNDYEKTKTSLLSIPSKYSGYYTYQNEYFTGEYKTYVLTFKVDVKSFDQAMNDLKTLGEIKSVNVYASDMTDSYTDAKAYLDSYTKEKVRIEELLSRANTVEEIIKVEDKLTELQRNIDGYQQQLTNIGRQTDYAQISATLEQKKPVSQEFYQWTGLREHLKNVVKGFDSVLVLISKLIGWAASILIVWIVYRLIKRRFF